MKNRIAAVNVLAFFMLFLFTGCAGKDEMSFSTEEVSEPYAEESESADYDGNDVGISESLQSQDVMIKEASAYRTVYVDICGAVNRPGVYALKEDARVFEAVEAAGGLTEDASQESVNQAEKITDGQKIYIMNQTEWNEAADGKAADFVPDAGISSDGKVNINTASESELCTLPGIGATRAAAIIAYRESCGGFKAIEEIQKVSGIKSGTYEKICDLIKVK